jgi:ProP effector
VRDRKDWARQKRRIAYKTRALLAKRYPLCFMGRKELKRPLAINITLDLCEACPDIPPRNIRIAVEDYTGGERYLKNMIAGAARVALDGSDAGTVTEAQARHAVFALAALQRGFARATARQQEARAAA